MTESKVKLVCSDGEVILVDRDIAEKSVLIKGIMDENEDEEIPLANVKRPILEKVIEFCIHMKDHAPPEIDKPLVSTDMSSVVDPWHAEFINLDQEVLFELIMASNYLDIKPLLELACAKVASLIKNKSVPEIRKFFNIENDFSPEEEQQIMEENKWAEESF